MVQGTEACGVRIPGPVEPDRCSLLAGGFLLDGLLIQTCTPLNIIWAGLLSLFTPRTKRRKLTVIRFQKEVGMKSYRAMVEEALEAIEPLKKDESLAFCLDEIFLTILKDLIQKNSMSCN